MLSVATPQKIILCEHTSFILFLNFNFLFEVFLPNITELHAILDDNDLSNFSVGIFFKNGYLRLMARLCNCHGII